MEGPTSSWGSRNRITCLTLQEHDDDVEFFQDVRKTKFLASYETVQPLQKRCLVITYGVMQYSAANIFHVYYVHKFSWALQLTTKFNMRFRLIICQTLEYKNKLIFKQMQRETPWHRQFGLLLTLILLTWRIWWSPNNASKLQMRFNSAFRKSKA